MSQPPHRLFEPELIALGTSRDFSHRVKSISLSTFTQDEVTNLEASGGNESARELWLASYNGGDNVCLPCLP